MTIRDQIADMLPRRQFLFAGLESGMLVVDLGCGQGRYLEMLQALDCTGIGVDVHQDHLKHCHDNGFAVVAGSAEAIPLATNSVDAVICNLVIPYTQLSLSIAECARVLKPGCSANIVCHGLGLALYYFHPKFRGTRMAYALRMLINSLVYAVSGRTLPGKLGDTHCQFHSQMRAYFKRHNLSVETQLSLQPAFGSPRFLCYRVTKPTSTGANI